MTRPHTSKRARAIETPPAETKPPAQIPLWLMPLTGFLAALCLFGVFSTEATDTDFWWHLKTGQYVVQQHSLPVPDPFAFTTGMNPPAYPGEDQVRHFNLTHEWLAQALMYVVYAVGGVPLVILARSAILVAMCGMVALVVVRRCGSPYAGIAAGFATAWLAVVFATDRPVLFSFLLVAVFLTICEFRRGLWTLPVLSLLWANLHGGFFLGWIVLFAYCAETIPVLQRFQGTPKPPQDAKTLWSVTGLSILLSAINPNGFGVLLTLFRYRQSKLQSSLLEWHSPYLWGTPYAFDVLLYACVAALLLSWRKVRLADWILFLIFAAASLIAFRNILLIGILAPILIATYFPWRIRLPRVVIAYTVPVAIFASFIMGIVGGHFFQLGAAMWKYPVAAADFMASHKVPGPIFNTYEDGGYLLWRLAPAQRVFIDGRALSETAYADYDRILYNGMQGIATLSPPVSSLLDRYGIQTVVMNTLEYNTGAFYPLATALAGSDWRLVYNDPEALIFERHPAADTPVLPDQVQAVADHMAQECSVHVQNAPDTPLCGRTLGDLFMRTGDRIRARDMLDLYLAHTAQRDPAAEQALQKLGRF